MKNFLMLLVLSSVLSAPMHGFAAIAVDNSSIHDQTVATTNVSFTYTPIGSPSIVIVQTHDVPLSTISAVTYAGSSILANQIPVGTADVCNAVFYAQNPTAGAQTVAITQSSSRDIESVISLTGTKLAGNPYGAMANTVASVQSVSLTLNAQLPNSIFVDCLYKDQRYALQGTDQTLQQHKFETGGSNFWGFMSTHVATSTTNNQYTSTTTASLMEYAMYEIFSASSTAAKDYITGAKGYIKGAKGYVR